MDLYVERQCIDQMKGKDVKKLNTIYLILESLTLGSFEYMLPDSEGVEVPHEMEVAIVELADRFKVLNNEEAAWLLEISTAERVQHGKAAFGANFEHAADLTTTIAIARAVSAAMAEQHARPSTTDLRLSQEFASTEYYLIYEALKARDLTRKVSYNDMELSILGAIQVCSGEGKITDPEANKLKIIFEILAALGKGNFEVFITNNDNKITAYETEDAIHELSIRLDILNKEEEIWLLEVCAEERNNHEIAAAVGGTIETQDEVIETLDSADLEPVDDSKEIEAGPLSQFETIYHALLENEDVDQIVMIGGKEHSISEALEIWINSDNDMPDEWLSLGHIYDIVSQLKRGVFSIAIPGTEGEKMPIEEFIEELNGSQIVQLSQKEIDRLLELCTKHRGIAADAEQAGPEADEGEIIPIAQFIGETISNAKTSEDLCIPLDLDDGKGLRSVPLLVAIAFYLYLDRLHKVTAEDLKNDCIAKNEELMTPEQLAETIGQIINSAETPEDLCFSLDLGGGKGLQGVPMFLAIIFYLSHEKLPRKLAVGLKDACKAKLEKLGLNSQQIKERIQADIETWKTLNAKVEDTSGETSLDEGETTGVKPIPKDNTAPKGRRKRKKRNKKSRGGKSGTTKTTPSGRAIAGDVEGEPTLDQHADTALHKNPDPEPTIETSIDARATAEFHSQESLTGPSLDGAVTTVFNPDEGVTTKFVLSKTEVTAVDGEGTAEPATTPPPSRDAAETVAPPIVPPESVGPPPIDHEFSFGSEPAPATEALQPSKTPPPVMNAAELMKAIDVEAKEAAEKAAAKAADERAIEIAKKAAKASAAGARNAAKVIRQLSPPPRVTSPPVAVTPTPPASTVDDLIDALSAPAPAPAAPQPKKAGGLWRKSGRSGSSAIREAQQFPLQRPAAPATPLPAAVQQSSAPATPQPEEAIDWGQTSNRRNLLKVLGVGGVGLFGFASFLLYDKTTDKGKLAANATGTADAAIKDAAAKAVDATKKAAAAATKTPDATAKIPDAAKTPDAARVQDAAAKIPDSARVPDAAKIADAAKIQDAARVPDAAKIADATRIPDATIEPDAAPEVILGRLPIKTKGGNLDRRATKRAWRKLGWNPTLKAENGTYYYEVYNAKTGKTGRTRDLNVTAGQTSFEFIEVPQPKKKP